MINVDFTNITNAKLIGRLLPWWIRGKRVSLLLQALLSPLASTHGPFKKWALDKYIECHITAQKLSLEWYLKYCLKEHFLYAADEFLITQSIDEVIACFSGPMWHDNLYWFNDRKWEEETEFDKYTNMNMSCFSTGLWNNALAWNNGLLWREEFNGMEYDAEYSEYTGSINVYAPAIVDTLRYNHDDYERDIRNLMSKYMINFKKVRVFIAGHY